MRKDDHNKDTPVMRDTKVNRLLTDLNLVVLFLIVVIISHFFFVDVRYDSMTSQSTPISDGWFDSDGREYDLAVITGGAKYTTVKRTFTSDEMNGGNLCFITSNVYFNIFMDGKIIYSFRPDLPRVCGKYYGDYIHYVNIPTFEGEAEITIVYEVLVVNSWTGIKNMQAVDSHVYLNDLLSKGILKFCVCVITTVIGIILVFLGLVFDVQRLRMVETVSLGVMAIILGLWTTSGTMMMQLLTRNSAVPRIIESYALMLLPVPAIIFTASFTRQLKSIFVKVLLLMVAANVVVTNSLVHTGVSDYHDMLRYTHITIAVGVVFVFVMIIRGFIGRIREDGKAALLLIFHHFGLLLTAFMVLIVSGVGDLIRYYRGIRGDTARVSRNGLAVFIILLSAYEVRHLLGLNKKSLEADLKDKMAHEDGLTGLLNRLAFNEFEERVASEKGVEYLFMQFDINDLKVVNDNYGHLEGDRQLRAGAEVLKETFEGHGEVFRIGGDEFFAIEKVPSGTDWQQLFRERIASLERSEEEYNSLQEPPVALTIAHGAALFRAGVDDPEDIEQKADDLMYECKRNQKETLK